MWSRPSSGSRQRRRAATPRRVRTARRWGEASLVTQFQWGILLLLASLLALTYLLPRLLAPLRWALFVYILLAVAWILTYHVYRRGAPAPPLGPPEPEATGSAGEVRRVVGALSRADRGMRYSQMRVLLRARRAFLGKVAASRDLTEADLEDLMRNPDGLRRLIGDPTLTEFLRLTSRETGTGTRPALQVDRGESWSQNLNRLLHAMEGWR